jgi:hypothetical protein
MIATNTDKIFGRVNEAISNLPFGMMGHSTSNLNNVSHHFSSKYTPSWIRCFCAFLESGRVEKVTKIVSKRRFGFELIPYYRKHKLDFAMF